MKYQLHWQRRREPNDSIFVEQGEAHTSEEAEAMMGRFDEVIERRAAECPEGFIPMVCTEDAKEFVRTLETTS